GFLPIGMAMFGPLADILPLQWIMIGSGIALIVIAGITYYSRELKTI
ncbi:MFS transporter, partial [Ruminococcus sp. AM58-7XD]